MVVGMLDIDPLTPEGMATTFVIIAIAYLILATGGLTLILGSVLVVLAAFVAYIVVVRIYRRGIGLSAGGGSK